jgi:hypothetical protein
VHVRSQVVCSQRQRHVQSTVAKNNLFLAEYRICPGRCELGYDLFAAV